MIAKGIKGWQITNCTEDRKEEVCVRFKKGSKPKKKSNQNSDKSKVNLKDCGVSQTEIQINRIRHWSKIHILL